MTRTQYAFLVVLVMISGCVGGAVSQRMRATPTAKAAEEPAAKPEAPKVVEAQQFRVLDAKGTIRAVLGMTPTGAAGLLIKDEAGNARVKLEFAPGGATSLAFLDEAGRQRAGFSPHRGLALSDKTGEKEVVSLRVSGYSAGGEPELMLGDLAKGGAIWLRTLRDGSPAVSLWNGEKEERASLSLGAEGAPELAFSSSEGKRVGFDLASDGKPRINLFAEKGASRPRSTLTADAEGWPAFQLFDKQGDSLGEVVFTADSGRPALKLRDKAGNLLDAGGR